MVAAHVVLALAAFVPQLASRPGVVDADTKSYLYLDPGRFLRQSVSMWDPGVGLGTVTHQQIGYLFPMGPFFWATHALGVPTWVAQRLWIGLILFAAAAGVLALGRTLGVVGPGPFTAAALYMVSPYVLQYVGHISVILLAWAALPWLVTLMERGLRRGDWRAPALIALTAAGVGSVNASSAFYVAVAPLLWLAFAGLRKLHPWSRVWTVLWRSAVLSLGTSAWWIAGLYVESHYGLDILRYTETVNAVASASLSSEVVRGLGYWYFYGTDTAGPWVPASVGFTTDLWVLAAGYVAPLAAFAGAFVTRWRHRAYFITLVVLGMVLAVGSYPYFHPSTVGGWLRDLFTSARVGMSLRSTDRAAPMVLLGLAMLAGAAVSAWSSRTRVAALCGAGALVALAVAANPTLWDGSTVPSTFTEPATPPAYVQTAAAALNSHGATHTVAGAPTRVWAVPGQSFAAYRYGTTVDPVWPALLDRPFVTREQQVLGSLPGEDLQFALDDPMQSATVDPAGLAPLARLLGAGDLLVQNDLAYERFHQPDPSLLWPVLDSAQPGLGPAQGYGTPTVNDVPTRAVDEGTLATTTAAAPPVATRSVSDPRPLVRTESPANALVVDGDAGGLVAAADVGLLTGDPAVIYSGSWVTQSPATQHLLSAGAPLVVTDSNRRQTFRWDNLVEVAGQTLAADQGYPKGDLNDQPLDLFPGTSTDTQSTTHVVGVASTYASSYGNPFAYLPEDRPDQAVDGNVDTAWETDTFGDPVGQWWQVTYQSPLTADAMTVVQPIRGGNNQWMTKVTLRFDGGHPMAEALTGASLTPAGQVLHFPSRRFRTLQIVIDATNLGHRHAAGGSPVGLAEVRVDDLVGREQVVMPTDLLRRLGPASNVHRLTVVMVRQRVAAVPPRTDPETALDRVLWLPAARTFTLTGTARIDQLVPDATVDAVIGRPTGAGQVTASAGERLLSNLRDTGDAALDGDPATVWSPPFGRDHQVGEHLTVDVPQPLTIDHLNLTVVADRRHSVPTALAIAADNGPTTTVRLPSISSVDRAGAEVTIPVSFQPTTGTRFTFTIAAVQLQRTFDQDSGTTTDAPVGIAELGLPGVIVPPAPVDIPAPCRSDLLAVDGRPVSVQVSGTTQAALDGTGLRVQLCGADAGGILLGPGQHEIVASAGQVTGLDLDRLVLDSAPGGGPQSADQPGALVPVGGGNTSAVRVVSMSATTVTAAVARPAADVLLVLGQSIDAGWRAQVEGGPDLGPPQLVDGYASGWLLSPADFGGRHQVTVVMRFAPQSLVDVALVVSAVVGLLCLVLAVWPRRRRPRPGQLLEDQPQLVGTEPTMPAPWWWVGAVGLVAGVAAGSITTWWAGGAVAVGVLVAQLLRRGRLLLGLVSVGLVLSTAVCMVWLEHAHHYMENGGWPGHFGLANSLTWGAVVLLGADAVIELLAGRVRPREPATSPPPSPPM